MKDLSSCQRGCFVTAKMYKSQYNERFCWWSHLGPCDWQNVSSTSPSASWRLTHLLWRRRINGACITHHHTAPHIFTLQPHLKVHINFIPVTNLMPKFLYSYNVTVLYMLPTVLCSSSGGQIVCIQHMVSSLSVNGRGCCARPPRPLTESDDTLCCIHTIWPPEDERYTARNM